MSQGRGAIAVIGMAGRLPDAPDLRQFWANLREGVESLRALSDEQLIAAGVPPQVFGLPGYVRSATILDDADCFDADFFGYAPREAEIMDPQHRLFLETAWSALEDSAYVPDDAGVVGVYASVSMNSYLRSVVARNPEVAGNAGAYQLMLGNDKDYLASRVSYKLDLHGPSIVVQTACSSSLVAIEMAGQALLNHQCDVALVGGASLGIPQDTGYLYQEGMIFSPDGHCRPFDVNAAGTRAGHGAGVVVLKRLQDAVADRDSIRAVVRGAAINNDGAGKVGYTAPSVEGQAEVIAMAHALADVHPDSIGYIETHGTGTKLGDPIEIAALSQVFRSRTDRVGFCGIGSLKGNIGHLDAAAGITGFIKAVLALEHATLPPSLNFTQPNPELGLESSPFYVASEAADFPAGDEPRRAAVSSFGIGGTNAHVVLEEGPGRERVEEPARPQLVVVSARSAEALDAAAVNLGSHLDTHPVRLEDVAYTSQVGKVAFARRRIVVASDAQDAASVLAGREPARALGGTAGEAPPVCFMFSGQGSQYAGMGGALYERFGVFRSAFDACAEHLMPLLDLDIREAVLRMDAGDGGVRLAETWLTQPALFTLQISLARLWMSLGVQPVSMIGHSIGEYAAAHMAGVFDLPDALDLVVARGRLMQALPPGDMFSVSLPEQDVRSLIEDPVSIAAVNAPSLCTISGPSEALEALASDFDAKDVPYRKLVTSHAFHSAMMDPVLPEFRDCVAAASPKPPAIPFVSNLTGEWIRDEEATDPAYWADHLRNAVRFSDGVRSVAGATTPLLLEVGPGKTLATLARRTVGLSAAGSVLSSLPHPQEDVAADAFLLDSVGRAWLAGVDIDWNALHEGADVGRVSLPTYPFQRKRYWVEPAASLGQASGGPQLALEKRPDLRTWTYAPTWTRSSIVHAHRDRYKHDDGVWLILRNAEGVGAEMETLLREAGRPVASAVIGAGWKDLGDGRFEIDPGAPESLDSLLSTMADTIGPPNRIVHAWTAEASREEELRFTDVADTTSQGLHSVLAIAQAFGREQFAAGARLTIVTCGTQAVHDDSEVTHPENATLVGPAHVIPAEYPGVDCRLVDLEADRANRPSDLAAFLLGECMLPSMAAVSAYRRGGRWEKSYESLVLDEAPAGWFSPRDGSPVYLITGGLGGLGLVFASALARTGPCVLALTARTPLPARESWNDWDAAASPEAARTGRSIAAVTELEALGAVVVTITADVADHHSMQVALADLRGAHGPVAGVIHAAGVPATGVIQLKAREAADSVLSPKVTGTLVLHDLVIGDQPDFFVLFSSINALVAPGGGSDYSSANAFLDAWAQHRRGRGDSSVYSINWDAWQDVGMAVDTEVPTQMQAAKDANLRNAMTSAEGLDAFSRVIVAGLPQVVVSPRDLTVMRAGVAAVRLHANLQSTNGDVGAEAFGEATAQTSQHERPDLATPYVVPETEVQVGIGVIWATLLGIDRVGLHDNFFELGGHSLLATRVLARLQQALGIALPLEAIFESPTVAELADRVETIRWMSEGEEGGEEEDEEREEFEI